MGQPCAHCLTAHPLRAAGRSDVKKMNQMMLYAKVVTIRDAQLSEKKVIQKERLEEERR